MQFVVQAYVLGRRGYFTDGVSALEGELLQILLEFTCKPNEKNPNFPKSFLKLDFFSHNSMSPFKMAKNPQIEKKITYYDHYVFIILSTTRPPPPSNNIGELNPLLQVTKKDIYSRSNKKVLFLKYKAMVFFQLP